MPFTSVVVEVDPGVWHVGVDFGVEVVVDGGADRAAEAIDRMLKAN